MMHFYFSDSSIYNNPEIQVRQVRKKVVNFSQSDVKKYILNIMKKPKIKNIKHFLCLLAWAGAAAVKVRVSN